jgi:hypothetical protein
MADRLALGPKHWLFLLIGLFHRDPETRNAAIFLAFDAVPRWARRRPYLWLARRQRARWQEQRENERLTEEVYRG